jgi:hypothetical protein
MEPEPDQVGNDALVLHQLKNHLSVVVSFCDLLLQELQKDDPNYADILEVRQAGRAALELVPKLSPRTS